MEHVVVGAGLAGAATAWQLARRGEQVTVLERTRPANPRGSSHGSARIFRYAYANPLYTDLVVRARVGWDELEGAAGRELIAPSGCLDHGDLRRPQELAPVLERAGVDHELLPAGAARDRWPQLDFSGPVLWTPGAGVIDAELAVRTMLELAVATGRARVWPDWEVTGVERTRVGLRVLGVGGAAVEAGRVVVAAGGWLPDLLPRLGLPAAFLAAFPALQVRQEQAFHFPYRPEYPSAWPTFIDHGPGPEIYGLPGGRDADFRGLKVAQFNGGRVLRSAAAQDGRVDPDNRRAIIDFATRRLPGVEPAPPYAETTCVFTNTPTADFVFDGADGVVVVSACSGHGAKFAPVLGELAADLATGRRGVPAAFRVAAAS